MKLEKVSAQAMTTLSMNIFLSLTVSFSYTARLPLTGTAI